MAGSRAMAGSSSLSTGPSAEEQMLAAAAELASFELPLARLAMPTVSEGLANVLQVSSYLSPFADAPHTHDATSARHHTFATSSRVSHLG